MAKTTTQSRRQRRAQFRAIGYLKIKNMFGRFSEPGQAWYNKMREAGNEAHEANVKRNLDATENALQTKANDLKKTWASIGYNDAEIAMLEEAFFGLSIKNKATRKEDKKAARKLMKDASNSLKSRTNANS
jgi:hypothetical protein